MTSELTPACTRGLCTLPLTRLLKPTGVCEWVCVCCDLDSPVRPDCPHAGAYTV